MVLSRNNIIIPIKNTAEPEYAILNPVSGCFDMMDEKDNIMLRELAQGKDAKEGFAAYLIERGYAFYNAGDERKSIDKAYEYYKKELEYEQIQLILIAVRECGTDGNKGGIASQDKTISKETVDAFFNFTGAFFAGKPQKPFITLAGQPSDLPEQRAVFEYIIARCADENYELEAAAGGCRFTDYLGILKKANVRKIHFTRDCRSHGGNNIIDGVDEAMEKGFSVCLHQAADFNNLQDVIKLAELLDVKGWIGLPPERFEIRLDGRSFFDCSCNLPEQADFWAEYSAQSRKYPILKKLYRPEFFGLRQMVDTGELFMLSFDACPAAKTKWLFDINGGIYGCTAGCARGIRLGTFYPEAKPDLHAIEKWQKRDVRSIKKCQSCSFDVICGGGCGAAAASKNGGDPLTADCRPIQELLEAGVNFYIDDIRRMTAELEKKQHEGNGTDVSCCQPETQRCGTIEHKTQGCVVCGEELCYSDASYTACCIVCGGRFITQSSCPRGHYICDTCHGADITEQVKRLLAASYSADPVELMLEVFKLPSLKMHGPEYHSIVPAVLVAAYQNSTGKRDESALCEAIRRGGDIKGGSCGYHGVCGAAAGAGIAASVIEKATPYKDMARGKAMEAAAHALLGLSRYGGPRCCKRDSVSSIESFVKHSGLFDGIKTAKYVCSQFSRNKECIGARCPYFPENFVNTPLR